MFFYLVSESRSVSSIIGLFLVFCIIIVGAYVVTFYAARFQKGVQQQRNLQVIEAVSIGQSKNLQLIRMGTKYAVIGTSRNSVQVLMTLDKEELILHDDIENQSTIPFKQILAKYKLDKNRENGREHEEFEKNDKK